MRQEIKSNLKILGITILIAIFFVFIGFLTGCERKSLNSSMTNNPEFNAEKLFDYEGCSIYRFYDYGNAVYYSKCLDYGVSETMINESCGEGCIRERNIKTN
jgi:hypothetical protein